MTKNEIELLMETYCNLSSYYALKSGENNIDRGIYYLDRSIYYADELAKMDTKHKRLLIKDFKHDCKQIVLDILTYCWKHRKS